MAAGAEVVGGIDESADFHSFLDLFHNVQRVFVGVCVGDSDDLFFRFCDIVTDERDELVQRSFSSAAFLVLDNKTVFVSAQDRFDA